MTHTQRLQSDTELNLSQQAFEKWQSEPLRIGTYHSNLEAWQSSRESLKQELLSDEMVAKTRFAIAEYYHNVGYDSEALAKAALKSVVEGLCK